MIRGVLFDMDGLMFDTERIGHRGWKYGAQVLGLELPDEVIAAGRGMSVADSRAMYLERLGPEVDYDALRALRVAYADEAIARDGLPVKPAAASGAFAGCGHPCGFGNGHCAGKGAALFKNGRRRRLF